MNGMKISKPDATDYAYTALQGYNSTQGVTGDWTLPHTPLYGTEAGLLAAS